MFRFQVNTKSLNITLNAIENQQQIRNFRFRKPPWVPRSKKAQFRIPAPRVPNLEQEAYMKPIWNEYKANMRSIYQLFKTEAKFSDKASLLFQEEQRIIREKEQEVLKKNYDLNEEILKQQLQDEDVKFKIKIAEAEKKLLEKMKIEELYRQEANKMVRSLKEKAKSFIDPINLDAEIEKMLDEKVDYNFSVDSSGNFFRKNTSVERAKIFNPKFSPSPKKDMQPEKLQSKESNNVH